jgi:hypothetical protein
LPKRGIQIELSLIKIIILKPRLVGGEIHSGSNLYFETGSLVIKIFNIIDKKYCFDL